mgnify:CR=1 FL=1
MADWPMKTHLVGRTSVGMCASGITPMNLWKQLLTDARELTLANTRGERASPSHAEFVSDGYQILVLQRLRERCRRLRVPLANHLLRRVSTAVFGIEIGNEVTLGEGVSFVHPIAVVIGGDSKIGNRVRFMGSNTIGTAKDNGYPIIEDDVVLGVGARVLGPVRVGRGAVVGANAVVLHDVPAGAVVTGIPAQVRHLKPAAALEHDPE